MLDLRGARGSIIVNVNKNRWNEALEDNITDDGARMRLCESRQGLFLYIIDVPG